MSDGLEGRSDFVTMSDEYTNFDERGTGRELVCLVLWDEPPERSGSDTINDDVTDIGDCEDPQLLDFEGEVGWEGAMLVKSPTDSVTLFQLPCKSFWAGFTTAGSV